MITVTLVGAAGLHLEALAAALAEAGEVECRPLSAKEFLSPSTFKEVDHGETVLLLDFTEEQRRNGRLFPKLRRLFPNGRVIYLVEADDPELGTALFNLGAWGIFPRDTGLATLKKAVRAVAAGEIWADRKFSSQVIRNLAEGNRKPRGKEEPTLGLTKREKQILALVAGGMKNRQIAGKLNISEMTVKVHLNSVFRKMGVKDRLQAALFAIHNQITPARIPID